MAGNVLRVFLPIGVALWASQTNAEIRVVRMNAVTILTIQLRIADWATVIRLNNIFHVSISTTY